jgi:hypothetical protein
MGGGVVPAHHSHSDASRSPRASEDQRKEQERKLSEELERTGEIQPKDITPVPEPTSIDVSKSPRVKRTSKPFARADTVEGLWEAAQEDATTPGAVQTPEISEPVDSKTAEDLEVVLENRDTARDSTQSSSSLQVASPDEGDKDGAKRLSITIPGSFD